jgi:thiol-disulfide isomerase/thioredoxin
MSVLIVNKSNCFQLTSILSNGGSVVACLCAAWCSGCKNYLPNFSRLAQRHQAALFAWIDIEDQSELIGELDIVNFPTLLIQHGSIVEFFGQVAMDFRLSERVILDKMTKREREEKEFLSPPWQIEANLLRLLKNT